MNIFQTVSRTVKTSVLDYNSDSDEWAISISGMIDGHEVAVDGEFKDVGEKNLARLEAWFCWYLIHNFLNDEEDHDVAKSGWQDIAKQSGLYGARVRTKPRRRR
jgi:hypothetical protein